MDYLEKLLGAPGRAKLIKLFLMNPEARFTAHEASRQVRVRPAHCSGELKRLRAIGLLRSVRGTAGSRTAGGLERPSRSEAFFANKEFPLFPELRALILKSAPHAKGKLGAKLRRLGNVKLAILAGVFLDNPSSRVDLLLVGDGLKKSRLKSLIQWLESIVGKELDYVAMSSQEFKYRMDMYDRFVRDVLEHPHETVINRLGA